MERSPNVKTFETTSKVINAIIELDGANTSETAEYLGMPTSTVNNHLQTLSEYGYLVKNNREYNIGPRFLEIGGKNRSRMPIHIHGRKAVDDLAQETGEIASIMIERGGLGSIIYVAKGDDAIAHDTHVGQRYPLHTNALGKSILSTLSKDRINTILEQHGLQALTSNTITSTNGLFEELDKINAQGYAVDDEERIEGLRCISAPVVWEETLYGSISITGPVGRLTGVKFERELPEKVVHAANTIRLKIQYSEQES